MTSVIEAADPLEEALSLIEAAGPAVPLRLVGGLAVRALTPSFPPRVRTDQDLDLASVSRARPELTRMLVDRGYEPDKRFNALYGHKQMFFASPEGRSVDVLIDRLEMCHALELADRIDRMPLTLDVADLVLSKLQIVELNEKDVRDVVYLLAAFPVEEGDRPGTIGLDRIRQVVAGDWGWWRTLTMNLEKVRALVQEDAVGVARPDASTLVPTNAEHDPDAALGAILEAANDVPKTRRWRIRARVGDRRRWYREPQEERHG